MQYGTGPTTIVQVDLGFLVHSQVNVYLVPYAST